MIRLKITALPVLLLITLAACAQSQTPETQPVQTSLLQNGAVQLQTGKAIRGTKCSGAPTACTVTLQQTSFNRLPGISKTVSRQAKGHSFGAFWKVGDGFTSTLVLRNKDSSNPIAANVILFSQDGSVEQQSRLEIAANSVARLPLSGLIRADNQSVHSGGLMLTFPDVPASRAIGDVIIENYAKGLIFDLPLMGGYRYDSQNALHAPWWLIDEGTDGLLTLFNQSDQDIVVSPSIIVKGTERTTESLSLAAHETKKLSIRELLQHQGIKSDIGSIALRYTGSAHALNPALLVANPATGFSLVSPFNARHENVESGQAVWRFPDVFLSSDPQLGFIQDQPLTAYAVVNNPGKSPISAQLTAYVNSKNGQLEKIPLPSPSLKPLETRLVNLSHFVASGLLPRSAPYISLAVSHNGVPGDLGLTVFSIGQNKDFVSRSEGLVRSGQIIDSTYWDISGDLEASLVVQNASEAPVQSKATLYYQTTRGEGSYSLPPINVPANGSRIFNLKKIILAGTPDSAGTVIPTNTTFGTLTLEVSDKTSHGLIFGGTASFDPVKGRYGLGAFPPNCDFCDFCEFCVEPTDTGGDCQPDCSDPSCCFEPPPPVPTFFIPSGATPLLSVSACPEPGTFGTGFNVHYQVFDQDGNPFSAGAMVPLETIPQFGIFAKPFSTPQVTTGSFDDFPVALCAGPPPPPPGAQACKSWTQAFSITLNGVTYPISTNTVVRGCIQGMTIQVLGNPQNSTFTIGTVN